MLILVETVLESLIMIVFRPELLAFRPGSFPQFAGGDDEGGLFLRDHTPEVTNSVAKRSLRCD
jgi:hypothetical protein